MTTKPPQQHGPHPDDPQYLHQYWFLDARSLIKRDTGWVYSVGVMEGFSRALLASAVTTSLELEPVRVVVRSAFEQFGLPREGMVLEGLRFERVLSDTGHVRLQGWRCYVGSGARRLKVEVLVYKDPLRVEHQRQ